MLRIRREISHKLWRNKIRFIVNIKERKTLSHFPLFLFYENNVGAKLVRIEVNTK